MGVSSVHSQRAFPDRADRFRAALLLSDELPHGGGQQGCEKHAHAKERRAPPDQKAGEKNPTRGAADPFFTTKSGKRIGMGIPLLAQASREAEGKFEISSTPEKGTRIRATFRYSHPDRKPLGNISETLKTLVVGNPGVDFLFEYRKGTEITCFDTRKGGQS